MRRLVVRVCEIVYLMFQISVWRTFRSLHCIPVMYVTSYRSLKVVQIMRGVCVIFVLCVWLNHILQCVTYSHACKFPLKWLFILHLILYQSYSTFVAFTYVEIETYVNSKLCTCVRQKQIWFLNHLKANPIFVFNFNDTCLYLHLSAQLFLQ